MALSQNANLTVLKLGYNNLGDAGVIILAAGIAIHRSIASLDLGFNNVGDEGCKALADAMTQQHDRYLEDQRHQQQQHHQHQSNNKNRMALSTSSSLEDMVLTETPVTSMSTSTHTNTPLFNRTSAGGSGKRLRNNGGTLFSSGATTTTTATTASGGTLRTLYLAGNLIGEDGALAMADCIRRGSSLRKLYMTGNRLGTFGVKALTEAIIEDEIRRGEEETTIESMPADDDANIVSIDEDNPANDGDASSVMTMMMNDMVTTTTTNSLHHNDTMHKLSSSNSFSSLGLQEIFLGGTGMGSGGCQAVARLLEKTSCLRVLSLPNCSMGDEEIGWLACSIKANRDKLPIESIQLSFNNMTHKGLESLMNALWGSSTLKELRLDNNEIGDRGAHQVAAILPYVKTLEVLDVGFNSIKTPGLNTLMKAVAETNHLQSLSVSGNALDVTAAKAVAYALAYNYSLVSLFLVHCSIGHEGQRHISAGVVSNSRTCLQKLTGFEIGRK
jgi:Ran GTPase-activating protein (RanGAP) involved in mRNA processing and transport